LQKPADKKDFEAASQTLYICLLKLSKLLAPFTPFFADALYMSLAVGRKSSVHLEDWPEADKKSVDYSLLEKMEEIRKISSLALALRAEKGIKVRQPLKTLEIKSNKLDVRDKELLEILKDEVNVKEVKWNLKMEAEVDFDWLVTPQLKEEGLVRELVRTVQGLRHDANYVPKDRVALMISVSPELVKVWEKHKDFIKKEVGAKTLDFKKSDKFALRPAQGNPEYHRRVDAELNTKLDDQPIWIGVRKLT